MDEHIARLLEEYKTGDGSNGMPVELYQYAQMHPEALIDRSGNNLGADDPMFNFYNPALEQIQGVDWFPNDDRNNPAVQAEIAAGGNLWTPPAGNPPAGNPGHVPPGAQPFSLFSGPGPVASMTPLEAQRVLAGQPFGNRVTVLPVGVEVPYVDEDASGAIMMIAAGLLVLYFLWRQ